MSYGLLTIWVIGGYLVGTIPFGRLVAAARGIDISSSGSGNAGATNVGRTLGKKWGAAVLLLDMGKGAFVSLMARYVAASQVIASHAGASHGGASGGGALTSGGAVAALGGMSQITQMDLVCLAMGVACVVGNIAPFYLGFRGGKGVATSGGVVLAVYPFLTLPSICGITLLAVIVLTTGYMSLGSIIGAASLPPLYVLFSLVFGWPLAEHYPLLVELVVLATIIIVRHRPNIARLRAGTENRLR